MRVLGAFALLALGALPASAQGDDRSACAIVKGWQPGPEAVAAKADANRWKSETSACDDHLYGINGQARNYDLARRCCLTRRDCNRDLAMIFANGWGVRRDYDAATFFLCRAEEEMAPAELSGMLEQIAVMRGSQAPDDLDYCEHVTSGYGMSLCQQLDGARAAPLLEARIVAMETPLDSRGKKALAILRAAADAFARADGARQAEDNRGGTIYPSVASGATQETFSAFVTTLERYAKARANPADAAATKRADDRLNQAFNQARKAFEQCAYCRDTRALRREVLRDAQRAWITYRDAWKAFYHARWNGTASPAALEREIVTALSAARTDDLLAIGRDEEE